MGEQSLETPRPPFHEASIPAPAESRAATILAARRTLFIPYSVIYRISWRHYHFVEVVSTTATLLRKCNGMETSWM